MRNVINVRFCGRQDSLLHTVSIGKDAYSRKRKFSGRWDTGATMTIISKNVIKALNLKPISHTTLLTANGRTNRDIYSVTVFLSRTIRKKVKAVEADLGSAGDILLGMDIIGDGDFAISTDKHGNTCLSYRTPSLGIIKF